MNGVNLISLTLRFFFYVAPLREIFFFIPAPCCLAVALGKYFFSRNDAT